MQFRIRSSTQGKSGLINKTKDELVEIVLRLEARLNRLETDISEEETRVIVRSEAHAPNLASLSFKVQIGNTNHLRIPAKANGENGKSLAPIWRLVLVSSDTRHTPLGLEIHDDVVVGREESGSRFGLDLTDYHAELLGVSRRHALLRPTKRSLFAIDLGSKNGTYLNGVRLRKGEARRLTERDIISFSNLHFMLSRIVPPSRI
jgi:hypothetical protein